MCSGLTLSKDKPSTQKEWWGCDPHSGLRKHMGLPPVLREVRSRNSQSPKGVLSLLKAMMRELVFGQSVLLAIQLEIKVTWSSATSGIPIDFKMLHSHTGLTDTMLEQVENHRTGPKIQGQHFSVVNKNSHNPLPALPHTDRHRGLYTACKPIPSENTSRQNWFYASCRRKGNLWKSSNSKITSISLNLTAIPLSKLYL